MTILWTEYSEPKSGQYEFLWGQWSRMFAVRLPSWEEFSPPYLARQLRPMSHSCGLNLEATGGRKDSGLGVIHSPSSSNTIVSRLCQAPRPTPAYLRPVRALEHALCLIQLWKRNGTMCWRCLEESESPIPKFKVFMNHRQRLYGRSQLKIQFPADGVRMEKIKWAVLKWMYFGVIVSCPQE